MKEQVKKHRREIKDILSGKDKRMLLITGPCSAWPSEAVLEYAKRLKALEEKVRDGIKLVLRVFIQKPRTTIGWAGPGTQPDPFSQPNLEEGERYAKELMQRITEMDIPIADEALFLNNAGEFLDMISWLALGARSTENQEHRIFASRIDCPVGIKNPTSGSIEIGVNGVLAAQASHTAKVDGEQVQTLGNPYAHLVLRGGINGPNYHMHDLLKARDLLHKNKLKNPAIIVDASHDNCRTNGGKDPLLQIDAIREVLSSLKIHPELKDTVRGFMLESFLKTGSQKPEKLTKETVNRAGLSLTDPCLGWEETKKLILSIYESLNSLA